MTRRKVPSHPRSGSEDPTILPGTAGPRPADRRAPAPRAHERLGEYEIDSVLGEGGMGAIFKARQLSMDRMVALKVLLHDQRGDLISVERFRHEAYLASRLKHPNAIVIHDFGQSGDGMNQ